MSDIVAYLLTVALFAIPTYFIFQVGVRIIQAVFQNQSILLSFPFL